MLGKEGDSFWEEFELRLFLNIGMGSDSGSGEVVWNLGPAYLFI